MTFLMTIVMYVVAFLILGNTAVAACWTYFTNNWDGRASQGTVILTTMGMSLLVLATNIS